MLMISVFEVRRIVDIHLTMADSEAEGAYYNQLAKAALAGDGEVGVGDDSGVAYVEHP